MQFSEGQHTPGLYANSRLQNNLERHVNILRLTLTIFLATAFLSVNIQAETAETKETQDIQSMFAALNTDIEELKFLSARISEANTRERGVLIFRQDERSFRFLADFDRLVTKLAGLPDGPAQLREATAQLTSMSEVIGVAVIARIDEMRQRINDASELYDSLSGGARIAAQANIQSMEAIHVQYYEALVNHFKSRTALGLSNDDLQQQLEPKLQLLAETLAGRIKLTNIAKNEVSTRSERDSGNTDLTTVLLDLDARHKLDLSRLKAVIQIQDSLGMDSSDFKAVMLQQASSFSIKFFSLNALASILKDSWEALKIAFTENTPDLIFRLFMFFLVLAIFRILARITRRIVSAASDRSSAGMSALLKNILVSTSGGTVMGIGILIALSQVGVSLAPMLAGLGVAGFIVGFALQDSLGNFAAGAMILIYRPFDVDDFVEVTGASGLVKKMNLVSTTITTFDNQTLVVPNSKIWGDVIKNVTAQTERRVDLEFGIAYDDDVEKAERVLTEIVESHDKVLDDPKPNVRLHTLGDSSVNFIVRPWVKTGDYWDVYWDLMREVKLRFDREGISIPFPQRDVHLYTQD
jgi:small conductance mechanosensitive channel